MTIPSLFLTARAHVEVDEENLVKSGKKIFLLVTVRALREEKRVAGFSHPRRMTPGIRTREGELPFGTKENRAFLAFLAFLAVGLSG